MPPRAARLAASAALLLAAAPAGAQTAAPADSLPARAGTWALEGGVGVNTTPTLGVLRFTGARTAVGFDVFGSYASRSTDDESTGAFGGDYDFAALGASLGVRRYAPVRGALAGFGTLGALASYARSDYDNGSVQRNVGVGGFGELGAAYVVARRLSVNAFTRATVTREFGRVTGQAVIGFDQLVTATQRTRGWSAAAGGVGLSATLFF